MGVDGARRLDELVPSDLTTLDFSGQRTWRRVAGVSGVEGDRPSIAEQRTGNLRYVSHDSLQGRTHAHSGYCGKVESEASPTTPHSNCTFAHAIDFSESVSTRSMPAAGNLPWCFVLYIGMGSVFVLNFASIKENSSALNVALVRLMSSYHEQRKIDPAIQPEGSCCRIYHSKTKSPSRVLIATDMSVC